MPAGCGWSGAPQLWQNVADASFSRPHFKHIRLSEDCNSMLVAIDQCLFMIMHDRELVPVSNISESGLSAIITETSAWLQRAAASGAERFDRRRLPRGRGLWLSHGVSQGLFPSC